MIRVAIVGAAGYAGGEMIRLLLAHPEVGEDNIVLVSASHAGEPVWRAHPDLEGLTNLEFLAAVPNNVDCVVLCLAHGASAEWMKKNTLSATTKVIDIGNDHRIASADHPFVYGLPEANRDIIRGASHVANPGCFATAIQLALLPIVDALRADAPVVVHAITGSTGAGQAPSNTTHYSWRANNVSVYKVFEHQHEPEIRQTLGDIHLHFVPLRGPFARGIHASVVLPDSGLRQVRSMFAEFYATHPFVHVGTEVPDMKLVVGTNTCRIGIVENGGALLVVSVIDNLGKGAAGQAIQNMNLMFGFAEQHGLHRTSIAY